MRLPGLSFDPVGFRPESPDRIAGLRDLARQDFELNVGQPPPQRQSMVNSGSQLSPEILFNNRERRLYVRGREFNLDSPQEILNSVEALTPTGGGGFETDVQDRLSRGWTPMTFDQYQRLIENTEDPTLGTRFSAGVSRGFAGSQEMLGRAIQATGLENIPGLRSFAEQMVSEGQATQERLSPWQASFTRDVIENDDDRFGGLTDWAVTTFGEVLPSIIESIGAGIAGAVAGGVAAGPVGGIGGAVTGLTGRAAFMQALRQGVRNRLAGQAVTAAQRRAIISASAMAAGLAQNYGQGVGDIYGRLREAGVDPDDVGARFLALGSAVPYAGLEFLPEFVAVDRLLRGGTQRNFARRVAGTAGTLGALEAITEAGQEAIGIGAEVAAIPGRELTNQDLVSLIDSLAAGFLVGGAIGGVAGLRGPGREPANLLSPPPPPPPPAPLLLPAPPPGPIEVAGRDPIAQRITDILAREPATADALRRTVGEAGPIYDVPEGFGPAEFRQPTARTPTDATPTGAAPTAAAPTAAAPTAAPPTAAPVTPSTPADVSPTSITTIAQINAVGLNANTNTLEYQEARNDLLEYLAYQQSSGKIPNKLKGALTTNLQRQGVSSEVASKVVQTIVNDYVNGARSTRGAAQQAAPAPAPGLTAAAPAPEPTPAPAPGPTTAAAPAPEPTPAPAPAPAPEVPPQGPVASATTPSPPGSVPTPPGLGPDDVIPTSMKEDTLQSGTQTKLEFGADIPQKYQNVIRGWLPLLGLDKSTFYVVSSTNIDLLPKVLPEKVFNEILKKYPFITNNTNDNGRLWFLGAFDSNLKDQHILQINKKHFNNERITLELIAHELGHAVQEAEFRKADSKTKYAIMKAYEKWFEKNKKQTVREFERRIRTAEVAKTNDPIFDRWEQALLPTGQQFDMEYLEKNKNDYYRYITSFSEWFADQVSRWATSNRKPLTVVEKFFSDLAELLRNFFVGEHEKFLPDATVAQWLNSLGGEFKPSDVPTGPTQTIAESRRLPPPSDGDTTETVNELKGRIRKRLIELNAKIEPIRKQTARPTLGPNLTYDAVPTPKQMVDTQLREQERRLEAAKLEVNRLRDRSVPGAALTKAENERQEALREVTLLRDMVLRDAKFLERTLKVDSEGPSSLGTRYKNYLNEWLADTETQVDDILRQEEIRLENEELLGSIPETTQAIFDTSPIGRRDTPFVEDSVQPKAGDERLAKPLVEPPAQEEFINGDTNRPLKPLDFGIIRDAAVNFMGRASVGKAAREGVSVVVVRTPEEMRRRFPGIEDELNVNEVDAVFHIPKAKEDTTARRIAEILAANEQTRRAVEPETDPTAERISKILSGRSETRTALEAGVRARVEAEQLKKARPVIIVAAYNIKSVNHLKFAMAHELHGHYGIQLAFSSKKGLEQIAPAAYVEFMEKIYNETLWVRREVEQLKSVYDTEYKNARADVREAYLIEEVLANRAALLETSLVARIWDKIKSFLNRLGVKTDDDLARHWIKQARIYVRSQTPPDPQTWQDILAETDANLINGAFRASIPGTSFPFGSSPAAAAFAQPGVFAQSTRVGPDNMAAISAGLLRAGRRNLARALEAVQTTDNLASRSLGLTKLLDVFRKIGETSKNLLGKYELMTSTARAAPLFGAGKGVPQEVIDVVNELLAYGSLHKLPSVGDNELKKMPDLLIVTNDGTISLDEKAFEDLKKLGTVTPEQFSRGIDWAFANGEKAGTYQRAIKATDPAYIIYKENVDTLFEAAKDRLLAEVSNYFTSTSGSLNNILASTPMSRQQKQWFNQISVQYNTFAEENRKDADIWLRNVLRTLHSKQKITDWTNPLPSDADYAQQRAAKEAAIQADLDAATISQKEADIRRRGLEEDDFIREFRKSSRYRDMSALLSQDVLENINRLGITAKQQITVLGAIQRTVLNFTQIIEQEKTTKRNIAGHYVPLRREGKYQVEVVAYKPGTQDSENPVVIRLSEDVSSALPYLRLDNLETSATGEAGANDLVASINDVFDNKVYTVKDDTGNDVDVVLKARASEAFEGTAFGERVNFNEVIRILDTIGANLSPQQREQLIVKISDTNSRIRSALQRSATPGWDKDVINLGVNPFLESLSRISARRMYVSQVDDIMNTNKNWFGDRDYLNILQYRVDRAQSRPALEAAEQELIAYAYMMQHMLPVGDTITIRTSRGPKKIVGLGQGNRGRMQAANLLNLYAQNSDIVGDDIDSWLGKVGSGVRTFTVLAQLGGVVASAALSLTSLPLAVAPYLAGFNRQTGRGGGFGSVKTNAELVRSLGSAAQLFGIVDEREQMQRMVDTKQWNNYGLTEMEARALLDLSNRGHLQSSQTFALMGTTYNSIRDRTLRAAAKSWMFLFNKLDSVTRAATALTALRLYIARAIASGVDPAAFSNPDTKEYSDVMSLVEETLRRTVGEHTLFNRPTLFRGPVGSIAYVYQQFKIMMVQLFRHLPASEQAKLIVMLIALGGLKALPFAEDIMDLIDTLMQKFKIKQGSVEAEIVSFGNSLMPGLGPILTRGLIDAWTGGTFSSRISMGDMLPFSGALLAGADPYQTIIDTIGPVASQVDLTVRYAGTVMDYFAHGAQAPLGDLIRQLPAAGVRNLSDTLVFMDDGSVSNNRGQLISENLPAHVLALRVLGFYPSEATFQNDVVRLSRRIDSYSDEIRRYYVQQYAVAFRRRDTDAMRRIVARVNEWNQSARGTEFEIKNFLQAARRAGEAASQSTVRRYHESASLVTRPTTEQLMAAYGLN